MSHATPDSLPRLFTFVGADQGPWAVQSARTLMGDALPPAPCLRVVEGAAVPPPRGAAWALPGITSNERYVERHEKAALMGTQVGLGRAEATHAALIPIRKSPAWWALTQDDRRAIFESQSHHIAIGIRYLPAVARGDKIAAFALSEPQAGSDVGAMAMTARFDDAGGAGTGTVLLDGTKTWISNGGIADYYCVFAKTDVALGTRGISAFIVDAGTAGLDDSEHIAVMAPHPLATLRFRNCRIPASAQLGATNGGFKLAMQTLDIFRASVAGAALGMARRALQEAVAYAKARPMFGQRLAEFQLTQARLGEMAALVDAGAMLTYRAAWLRDCVGTTTPALAQAYSAQAAMAKMVATENAQRVIDMALQMHGGLGVKVGTKVESLYRDIRSLRIYEGATEVQQLIIGKSVLKG